ncbi:MAG: 2-keto-3-deoxy-D-arabinonate dehydratase [Acidobacteria bacterium]|nr:2-keto-3-deoxy-D-arabinonate dehydratase [Acidobacteriota bacterium]
MRLGQIQHNDRTVAAIFEGAVARPIPDYTLLALLRRAEDEGATLAGLANRLVSAHREAAEPLLPISPREVWACGCTYETSAAFRDAEHGTREGFYAHVYREPRPELFFKGTGRVCVGPNQAIGLRPDSKFTAPEPELAVLLDSRGVVHGYTLCNDVSAWDIERENPLYLPQSKVYNACCALGPVFVTPDELTDPYNLYMTCTITRDGATLFAGETSTARLHRKIETLVEYLVMSNSIPCGTVLSTGTGIIVTEEAALRAGDVCTITVDAIGTLSNVAAIV